MKKIHLLWAIVCLMNWVPKGAIAQTERQSDFIVEKNTSNRYLSWYVHQSCVLSRIKEPEIRICVQGSGDLNRAKEKAEKAMGLWLDATGSVLPKWARPELVLSCDKPHASVSVHYGSGGEFASPGAINVGDQSAFGTYLHEFGHAFACLGDTYVGGMAGQCMQGQPHSIMCDGLLRDDLSEDDVQGLSYQIARFQEQGWIR